MGQHIEAMPSSLTIRYAIKTKKAAENQLLFAYRVELEELEPLVSRRITKTQNRLFTSILRFRAFGGMPRNPKKDV